MHTFKKRYQPVQDNWRHSATYIELKRGPRTYIRTKRSRFVKIVSVRLQSELELTQNFPTFAITSNGYPMVKRSSTSMLGKNVGFQS